MTPAISVCIPTYNGASFIARAIESLLTQDLDDFEIVIGDDGSSDGTLDVVRGFDDPRIRVLPDACERGPAANFNRVVEASRAPWVKLVCQDDRLYADCLSKQLAVAQEQGPAGVVMVSCRRDIVDALDRVVYPSRGWKHAAGVVETRRALRATVRSGTNIIGEPSAVLFERAAFDRAGGFDPAQRYMIDLDLWMRMLTHGRLAFVPEALCTFRVSPSSWSSQLARSQAREARRTLVAIRRSHERDVRWIDVALGYPKPTLLALARRTFFRVSPNLPERRGHLAAHEPEGVRDRTAPDPSADTTGAEYTARLTALQQVWWKRVLPVQAPYRWNLRRLDLGFTLELGCGIGRNLEHLRGNAVGVDHNEASVRVARARGFEALTSEEFETSRFARPHVFDSVLCAHVLEHMTREEAVDLLRSYLPHLRPGGKLVLITPQERGFASDASHVEFLDEEALAQIIRRLQLSVARSSSFPFPRSFGNLFVYNEFVVVGEA